MCSYGQLLEVRMLCDLDLNLGSGQGHINIHSMRMTTSVLKHVTVESCTTEIWTILCLSVTLVYCGQTVGWIKMPFGKKVGLGQGDIMLDGSGTQLFPHGKGHSTAAPTFRPMPIVAKRSPISATAELLLVHELPQSTAT